MSETKEQLPDRLQKMETQKAEAVRNQDFTLVAKTQDNILGIHEQLHEIETSERMMATPFAQTYFHGSKADLKTGDRIEVGFNSNFGERKSAKYIFLTGTLDAAVWGAELAAGEGPGRIYIVEPTGPIENDPDLTDRKFPGNPTQSFRSEHPFRVLGEVTGWQGHPASQVNAMKAHLAKLLDAGIGSLND